VSAHDDVRTSHAVWPQAGGRERIPRSRKSRCRVRDAKGTSGLFP
jgi:hypothetical protein